ncbi:MAG: ABC transporter ATP-binding protein [Eubacterium sp.]|nr:ABC transporter ATP-binding protein [Eubacterium sp.]
MNNEKVLLSLHDLSHSYHGKKGETVALDHINFNLSAGEFSAIVGASGCGKSTLLDLIAGLLPVQKGELLFPDAKNRPSIGYMLQKDHLLEHRTVYRNVLLGLEIRHQLTEDNISYVRHLMEQYGILEFAHAFPRELSGGMRQRAALIRTLALKPDLLLLDEPFSALDYQTRLKVTEDIIKIIRGEGITTLLVTHDLSEAISTAERVIVLGKRPGHIKAVIPIDFGEDHPLSPQEARLHPRFPYYFNKLWKELCDES